MKAIERICSAYENGYSAISLAGRSIYDLECDESGKVRPLIEMLRSTLLKNYGMVFISYSLAAGLDWNEFSIENQNDRKTIHDTLRAYNLLDIPQDENEAAKVIRGISLLSRTNNENLKWSDKKPLKFAFLIDFSHHIIPCLTNGSQTDQQIIAIELVHLTAQSLAVRTGGNFIIFHGKEDLMDGLATEALHSVRIKQPDKTQKLHFIESVRKIYTSSKLEPGVSNEILANLTDNTPNRSIESLIRASHKTSKLMTIKDVCAQKNRDVEELSEHTLKVLDTSRIKNVELIGINAAKPRLIINRQGEELVHGNTSMHTSILFVGSPGVGKTDLALLLAEMARVSAYQLLSPKGGIVGETERKTRLQMQTIDEWTPNIAFIDEITESFPTERSDFDGDSGASRAIMASMLTNLSNDNKRGKSLLVATTNCVWRIGHGLLSRFTVIPILRPLIEDYPYIICEITKRINPEYITNPGHEKVIEAANIFYNKGASPRHIRTALSNTNFMKGSLNEELILFSSFDYIPSLDSASSLYSELWAIKSCSSYSFLPWSDDPANYRYPDYLKEFVNIKTGEINLQNLDKKIAELRKYANV